MGRIPVLRPREVEAILRALGFEEARQRGSHISPVLLRQIAKDIGLSIEDFLRHR